MDKRTQEILAILRKHIPSPDTELCFDGVFQLLAAVILSAQCTDKRVNEVTKVLFKVAPTPQAMAALPLEELERIIFPCGFYKHKAVFLKEASRDIVERFGGEVPSNKSDLLSLKGVGEKTANVVYAVGFGGQAIAVDTHVFRVSNRLGISDCKNVSCVQKTLEQKIPEAEWADSHHYLLLFGRYVCKSQNPDCLNCYLRQYCVYPYKKELKMFQLLKKTQLTENVTEYVFHAPKIAVKGKPGQFVLFRISDLGERIPITLCDTDPINGTITLLIQAIGASTIKLSNVPEGGFIKDIVGPLGKATDLGDAKTVLLVAGGIGIAVLYPQAKQLQKEGKHVVCIMGARSEKYLTYVEKMREVCDELLVATDDGSYGQKGFVTVFTEEILRKNPGKFDLAFTVGPLKMMKAVCDVTKQFNLHTVVSMNPIMIDGTGMCGGCRLTVGGVTKYACVDGPEFDGHTVDFEEVINRSRFYEDIEREHLCRLTGGIR